MDMARKARRNSQITSPSLIAFGNQVRHYRDQLGLSQDRLGERFPVSGSYIGQIEMGKTRCTEEFAEKLDKVLGTNGAVSQLWTDLVQHVAYPVWFDWPAIERQARMLQSFQLTVVDGLLQTRNYAMALLEDESAVEGRMERQNILTKGQPPPPALAVLLDEAVLHRNVGGPEVMREQLNHLTTLPSRRLTIQVVPSGAYGGLSGSFVLATMDDRSEVAYVETALRGMTMGGPADMQKLSETLYSLRANAYSIRESTELIRRVVEEKWT